MIRGLKFTIKGGPGSGNFGHAGIPGKVGGSARSTSDGMPLLEFKPFKEDPTSKLNPASMTREEFKHRWLQSAQTEQGIPISDLSEGERKNWVGSPGETVIRIYRGTEDYKQFEPGDFVTTSIEYAKSYGGKVAAMDVPVRHLRYMRGSIHGDPKSYGDNTPPELIFAPIQTKFHIRYHSYDWEKFQ